jgi:hypothetical protein
VIGATAAACSWFHCASSLAAQQPTHVQSLGSDDAAIDRERTVCAGQGHYVPAGTDDGAQRATEPLDAHRAGGDSAPYPLDDGQLLAKQAARREPGIGPGDCRQDDEVAA